MHGCMDVFTISRRDRKRVRKVRKGRERERDRETETGRNGDIECPRHPGPLTQSHHKLKLRGRH